MHPLLARLSSPDQDQTLHDQEAQLRDVQEASYGLGHQLGGDALAPGHTPGERADELIDRLCRYLHDEEMVTEQVERQTSPQELADADERFRRALARALSRAHLWTPRGAGGHGLRTMLAAWDRLVDTIDSRDVVPPPD